MSPTVTLVEGPATVTFRIEEAGALCGRLLPRIDGRLTSFAARWTWAAR
jgi:hypothetical protein